MRRGAPPLRRDAPQIRGPWSSE